LVGLVGLVGWVFGMERGVCLGVEWVLALGGFVRVLGTLIVRRGGGGGVVSGTLSLGHYDSTI